MKPGCNQTQMACAPGASGAPRARATFGRSVRDLNSQWQCWLFSSVAKGNFPRLPLQLQTQAVGRCMLKHTNVTLDQRLPTCIP